MIRLYIIGILAIALPLPAMESTQKKVKITELNIANSDEDAHLDLILSPLAISSSVRSSKEMPRKDSDGKTPETPFPIPVKKNHVAENPLLNADALAYKLCFYENETFDMTTILDAIQALPITTLNTFITDHKLLNIKQVEKADRPLLYSLLFHQLLINSSTRITTSCSILEQERRRLKSSYKNKNSYLRKNILNCAVFCGLAYQ